MTTTALPEITAALVVDVFTGSMMGFARQVLMLDAGGRTRLRVHARDWEPGTVEAITSASPSRATLH